MARKTKGPKKQDWELWERVAETVQPIDRTISPLARARNRSMASSANAGANTGDGAQAETEAAALDAYMEAHVGGRAATTPSRKTRQPVVSPEPMVPDPAPAVPQAPYVRGEPMAPFLPAWRPAAQLSARAQEAIDRKTKRKLTKGKTPVDARIDLHGMTQDEAHNALIGFIGSSQARGHRMVLVITGKGLSKGGQGVLRRAVPHWLVTPPLGQWVNGHDVAGPQHGGDGALYVRLRRPADRAATR